jgi:hypothetical protein
MEKGLGKLKVLTCAFVLTLLSRASKVKPLQDLVDVSSMAFQQCFPSPLFNLLSYYSISAIWLVILCIIWVESWSDILSSPGFEIYVSSTIRSPIPIPINCGLASRMYTTGFHLYPLSAQHYPIRLLSRAIPISMSPIIVISKVLVSEAKNPSAPTPGTTGP